LLRRTPFLYVEIAPLNTWPSEWRVATTAADGMTNRDIAQALFVSPRTVEVHLSSTYRKLGVRSRSQLPDALAGPVEPRSEREALTAHLARARAAAAARRLRQRRTG
jgi:DNA-binding NarL/FixJ family response regulator